MLIDFNNTKYYRADYVKEINPAFFHGCARSIRYVIDKKKLTENDYIYATFSSKENKWSKSSKEINKASLLLTEEYVNNNVPGFGNNTKKLDLEIAPPLLTLEDNMKFRDENGNIIEIETRGERTMDGIYFYGKDVEKMLQLACIKDILNDKTSRYEEGKHYKKFIYKVDCNPLSYTDKIQKSISVQNQETIFLTYFGLVRMLITRRNPIAEHFQKWALQTLFTSQLGTKEEKQELCSKMLGCDINSVRSFLNTGVQEYSELYLICIGQVKNLSEQIHEVSNKNPEEYLFKYGYTSNLYSRLQAHKQTFNKIKGVNISLVLHCPIDDKFLSQAEVELKQSFQIFDCVLEHQVYKELVVFNESKLTQFKTIFKNICDKYAGNCKQLQEQIEKHKLLHDYEIKELNLQMKELKTQYEIRELNLKLENEINIKNLEKQIYTATKQMNDELINIIKNIKS
jgi:hypothetical protein